MTELLGNSTSGNEHDLLKLQELAWEDNKNRFVEHFTFVSERDRNAYIEQFSKAYDSTAWMMANQVKKVAEHIERGDKPASGEISDLFGLPDITNNLMTGLPELTRLEERLKVSRELAATIFDSEFLYKRAWVPPTSRYWQ